MLVQSAAVKKSETPLEASGIVFGFLKNINLLLLANDLSISHKAVSDLVPKCLQASKHPYYMLT